MKALFFISALPILIYATDWTALVYMAADNNLADYADSDLVEMTEVGSSDAFRILVQVDKPSTGGKRMLVQDGYTVDLEDLGTIDMCDWQTLADFIEWGMITYPADKYLLILWDHGTGWTVCRRTFGSDNSSGTQMSISNGDLRKAFSTAYSYTGEIIDVCAFDACLMGQVEIAFEVQDYASFFCAPQTLCPGEGYCYDKIFHAIRSQPGMSARACASRIVNENVAYYTESRAVAYGAIDLTHLDEFFHELHQFFEHLIKEESIPELTDIRAAVQTIPVSGLVPNQRDEHVDFGDFLNRFYAAVPGTKLAQLLSAYNSMVVAYGSWGDQFAGTTGVTTWFPLYYRDFKQLLDYYDDLMWTGSSWPRFLNWYYDADDIRPTDVYLLRVGSVGDNNDYRLYWTSSHDLSNVTYNVLESPEGNITTLFSDDCEEIDKWYLNGFTLNSTQHYSGTYSFFSGDASNLRNSMETQERLYIADLGILRVHLYYDTEDMADSLIIEYGSFRDVHYGWSHGWQERVIVLPSGNHPLRFLYLTNEADNHGGCYIDDVMVNHVDDGYYVKRNCADTTMYIYNKPRGVYRYAVYSEDAFRNTGNLTDFLEFTLDQYAVPYSNPSPFLESCEIVLDYPEILQPTIDIFSITGRKVRHFVYDNIVDNRVYWDGKDNANRAVGAGLYFVVIKDGEFKKVGKIARQR